MPSDYLPNSRNFHHFSSKTEEEILQEIKEKRCKTCNFYDFYRCKALEKTVGPDSICISPEHYCEKIIE
ncbi:MAG: hypothetical protein ACTSVU_09095 [Promethearchaeota archaeon]